MDPAEAWLQTHDLAYLKTRQGWKHLNEDGEYETPWQEIPAGLGRELEGLIVTGEGRYVETPDWRTCESCGEEFVASDEDRLYCSSRCKEREKKRRQRARKRAA